MYDLLVLKQGDAKTTVHLQETDKTFVLGIPEQVLREAKERGIDHSFFTDLHAPAFYNADSIAELGQQAGIKSLAGRIETAALDVATTFMTKIEKGLAAKAADPSAKVMIPTNGLKYGVSAIEETSSDDVTLMLHNSDHFTFTVSNMVFNMLRQEDHPAVSDEKLKAAFKGEHNDLGFFFNSLGLNASIVVGKDYVVGVRANGDLHVAMNEGLVKKPNETPDIASWFARGMKNELGIVPAPDFVLREVFMVPSVGQLGIHVLAQIDSDLPTIRENHVGARDAWENQKLLDRPFTKEQMQALADSKEPTIGYTRGLLANLAGNWDFSR